MKAKLCAKDILGSGLIEEYCLGVLNEYEITELEKLALVHPEIQKEIDDTRLVINQFAKKTDGHPDLSLKDKIFQSIFDGNKDEADRLSYHHFINPHSDLSFWKDQVAHIEDPGKRSNIHLHPIKNEGKTEQFIAWVKSEVDDEVHEDMIESFLILEGTCCCHLNDQKFDLKPGDFLEIPLYTRHSLCVSSKENVKAILQRIHL